MISIKRTTVITISLLLLAGCALFNIKQTTLAPEISLETIRLGEFNNNHATVYLNLDVNNPNNYSLPSYGLSLVLYANNSLISKIDNLKVEKLAAKESKILSVPVLINNSELEKIAQTIRDDHKIDYRILGKINIYGLPHTFELADSIHVPTAKLVGIDILPESTEKLTLLLKIEFDNPNNIEMPAYDIDIDILVFGKTILSGITTYVGATASKEKQNVELKLSLSLPVWENLFAEAVRNRGKIRYQVLYKHSSEFMNKQATEEKEITVPIDKILKNPVLISLFNLTDS